MRRKSTRHGWPIARALGWIGLLLGLCLAGCTRSRYRQAADLDSYSILQQKAFATPWGLPAGFSIDPDPRSRFFDPTSPVDPALPYPGPHLYGYELPELGPRAAAAETAAADAQTTDSSPGQIDARLIGADQVISVSGEFEQPREPSEPGDQPAPSAASEDTGIAGLPIQPIPDASWKALPPQCLSRMLEFASVREEYRRQYGAEPPPELRDPSRKLTLHEIVDLALLNSREYQAQKEQLYSAALALTLARYDYLTKLSSAGNGADVNYSHSRRAGTTVNSLGIPSSLQADKMLAIGGDLVARFANDVVLTFNGPEGFAADVSSELLFDVTQSVFQRDTLLEPLVQSERNVVYQAREFARFRKEFFFQRASDYYSLLETYRRIEINAQNYFSLVRGLEQAEAEVRAGVQTARPQVEIDQLEQSMLSGRSALIGTCNSLEGSLDRLKLTMGLPTEMPINLDLAELERLTLRDEIEVTAQLVRRARSRLEAQLAMQPPDRNEIVSTATVLVERLLDWLRLRERLGQEIPAPGPLEELRFRLRVDEARLEADRARNQLRDLEPADPLAPPPPPILRFQRTMDLLQALLDLVGRQLELAERLQSDPQATSDVAKRYQGFQKQAEDLRDRLETLVREARAAELGTLLPDAENLLKRVESLTRTADSLIGAPPQRPAPAQELKETIEQTERLLGTSESLMADAEAGLVPVDMHVDDAMVTALVQRLDLMNQRGALADDWRAIKIAADDLKSVLNLNASQSIRTQRNRPFGFTFDESTTRLNMSLDLPLNRQSQRNSYRRSLINYQAGLRGLMALEDGIKLEVRDRLRQLDLDRVQYQISVASAALASERVFSTRLELALGLGATTVRDFLEAQDAYRQDLTDVAGRRIGYILNRAQFALDLELMMLDDSGFWPEIYNEQYQPQPNAVFPPNAGPVYGRIPPRVKVSKDIQRMLHFAPPGWPAPRPMGPQRNLEEGSVPPAPEPLPAPMPEEIQGPVLQGGLEG